MDHTSFTEICLHQLKMSGVRNGERLVVLTQGNDRLAYADAFMAAGQRLGAQLRSYIKPIRELAPGADHRAHKGLNNRIEGSHRPTRKREKLMGKFKSPRQAQRFLAAHDQINTIFRPRRYRLSATSYRHARSDARDLWAGYALEMTA